jgi:hypothetical protein
MFIVEALKNKRITKKIKVKKAQPYLPYRSRHFPLYMAVFL